MSNKRKALLIGGAGFIGSYLANKLFNEGYEVEIVDCFQVYSNIEEDHLKKVAGFRKSQLLKNAVLHNGKFEDIGLKVWSEFKPDIVVHLAALPLEGTDNRQFEVAQIVHDHSLTYQIAYYAREFNTKVIYMSSLFAYGNTPKLVKETHPLNPTTAYGIDKAAGEFVIKNICPRWNIIRSAGIYGFGDANMRATQIFMMNAMKKKNFWVNSNAILDFIYIKDFIDGLFAIVDKDIDNEIFHISGGKARPLSDFVKELAKKFELDYYEKGIKDRPSFAAMSNAKAKRMLDWKPKYTLRKGVAEYISHAKLYKHA